MDFFIQKWYLGLPESGFVFSGNCTRKWYMPKEYVGISSRNHRIEGIGELAFSFDPVEAPIRTKCQSVLKSELDALGGKLNSLQRVICQSEKAEQVLLNEFLSDEVRNYLRNSVGNVARIGQEKSRLEEFVSELSANGKGRFSINAATRSITYETSVVCHALVKLWLNGKKIQLESGTECELSIVKFEPIAALIKKAKETQPIAPQMAQV